MTGTKLFQLLKSKIGEQEADALITYVDNSLDDNNRNFYEAIQRTFATKSEFFATKIEFKEEFGKIREEFGKIREELARVEGRMDTKIVEVKSDVLRWMFAFFVTMMLAIIGLYLKK
jgi:hypothetical protein